MTFGIFLHSALRCESLRCEGVLRLESLVDDDNREGLGWTPPDVNPCQHRHLRGSSPALTFFTLLGVGMRCRRSGRMPRRALSQLGPWASACVAAQAAGLRVRCRSSGRGPRQALSQVGPYASACALAARAVGLGMRSRKSGGMLRHALSQVRP